MAKQHPINRLNHKLRKEYKQAIKTGRELRHAQGEFNWRALFEFRPVTGVLLGVLVVAFVICYFVTREDKGPPPPRTYSVRGKITVSGGPPITGGLIEFRAPAAAPGDKPKSHKRGAGKPDTVAPGEITIAGEINSDGTYRLHTLRRRHRAEGAPVGHYEVTIVPQASGHTGRPIVLPQQYEVAATKNDINIVVTSDPKKQ